MSDLFTTRRRNLRRLIQMNYNGNQSLFARSIGRGESYINRLLTDPLEASHGKNLGERLARDMEFKLRLDEYWFDKPEASLPEWRAVEQKRMELVSSAQTFDPQRSAPTESSVREEIAQLASELASLSVRLSALMSKV